MRKDENIASLENAVLMLRVQLLAVPDDPSMLIDWHQGSWRILSSYHSYMIGYDMKRFAKIKSQFGAYYRLESYTKSSIEKSLGDLFEAVRSSR